MNTFRFGYSEGYNDDGGFAVGALPCCTVAAIRTVVYASNLNKRGGLGGAAGGEDADFNDTTDAGAGAGAGAEAATDTKGDDDGPAISAVAYVHYLSYCVLPCQSTHSLFVAVRCAVCVARVNLLCLCSRRHSAFTKPNQTKPLAVYHTLQSLAVGAARSLGRQGGRRS